MSMRAVWSLLAAGLLAGTLLACQAPGFMGLNGETTIPGLGGLDSYTLARVPIRVVLPAEVAPGKRASDRLEVPVEDAKVFLALDPEVSAQTDAEGIAPLTIPVNGVQVIRAEIRTASGTLRLEGLMGLPFSRVRESSGPNTVTLPSLTELNEPLTLSLASTLVAAHLQERFSPEQIRYLDPTLILAVTREVSQLFKPSGEGYRVAAIPDLTEPEDIRRVARELVARHAKVREAFDQLFATRVPVLTASPSASASAELIATASVEASPSVEATPQPLVTAGIELFPLEVGVSATYTLLDADQAVLGTVQRTLTKVTRKANGVTANGRLVLSREGQTAQWRFMLKRHADRVQLSLPFRPELTYPLPFTDGAEWIPAPGLLATATYTPAEGEAPGTWTVSISGDLKGQPVAWTEVYQPEVGLVAFTWGNDAEAPMATLLPAEE